MQNDITEQKDGNESITTYRAQWVLPISRPPIEDGAIAIQGNKIIAVGTATELCEQYGQTVYDLEAAVIFPAFINVHTHLEHSRSAQTPESFADYQKALQLTQIDMDSAEELQIIASNIEESLGFGTVALADCTRKGASVKPLLESWLYARVFHEVTGFQGYKADYIYREHQDVIQQFQPSKSLTQHLAPSSSWTVSPELFRLISVNERHIAIHMGMSPDEREFTLNGTGALRQILAASEDFDYSWEAPGLTPVDYFFGSHFFAKHNILIHMVDTCLADIETIKTAPAKANICVCPRTAEILSLGKIPFQLFLEKGLNVCIGTESRLVVPDLDVRKEMLACVETYGVRPENVMKFATLNGAYAIGFHREVGSLDEGKTSRCLVVRTQDQSISDPFEMILNLQNPLEWLE